MGGRGRTIYRSPSEIARNRAFSHLFLKNSVKIETLPQVFFILCFLCYTGELFQENPFFQVPLLLLAFVAQHTRVQIYFSSRCILVIIHISSSWTRFEDNIFLRRVTKCKTCHWSRSLKCMLHCRASFRRTTNHSLAVRMNWQYERDWYQTSDLFALGAEVKIYKLRTTSPAEFMYSNNTETKTYFSIHGLPILRRLLNKVY